ncbi:MAG: quinate 5-dehydrogenase [Clostridia bacterium]|nr:MAG: quinate 5-dehydrogenase [Clostridia bacterium]
MKRVISISLGSSKRDHVAEVELLGETFHVERRGTDGDSRRAEELIRELDGKVDAFGLGGTDLYLVAGKRRYVIRDSANLVRAARRTPIVDGSGLKDTLERKTVEYLEQEWGMSLADKRVLVVSAVDRFGLAEALAATRAKMFFGDLIFSLGIPIPITSLATLRFLAWLMLPVICRIPFKYIYPTGSKQEEIIPRYEKYYLAADVIAGDFHYIRRHLPPELPGKIIITNTVTGDDVELLRARGVKTLVTTTPEFSGRSFGTNVLEAMLVAYLGRRPDEIAPDAYHQLLETLGFAPRVEVLN